MWNHFVYIHKKANSEEIFYVGKGKKRKGRFERAYVLSKRNLLWNNTVKKYGLKVEIFASCKTDLAAQEIEKDLINKLGRRDKGLGILVNMTEGGDGHCGIIISEDLREKRRINARGKRSKAWCDSIKKSRKNGGNGGVVKLGDKLPSWWRDRISKSVSGSKNGMFGRSGLKSPVSKIVIDTSTGVIFPSISSAALEFGLKMKTLHNQLTGQRKNKTSLRFLNGV